MKKVACIVCILMLVMMLGGCYKSDTTIGVGVNGGVKITGTILATKSMYETAQGQGPQDVVNVINDYMEYYGAMEKGEMEEIICIDENGNVLEDAASVPDGDGMVGTKLSVRYNSLSDATSSMILSRYLVTTPLTQDESGYGIRVEEKRTLIGTKYSVSGKFSVYGNEQYKNAYDTAEEEIKNGLDRASASITFTFPCAFCKSNADVKGFMGTKLTWTANADAPDKDVYFEAMVINPLVLCMALVILALLIVLIVLLKKGKKDDEPDAYFVDAEGNKIPVYDAEDDETAEETAEDIEDAAEEVTEAATDALPEEDAAVTETIENAAEETTPETDAE